MIATFHPRATARIAVPNAAVDLPLPSPVLIRMREVSRVVALLGGSVGGLAWSVTSPHRYDGGPIDVVDNAETRTVMVPQQPFLEHFVWAAVGHDQPLR